MKHQSLYTGDDYHDYAFIKAWCQWLAKTYAQWVTLETYGKSREGRPLLLLTLNIHGDDPLSRPAFWLDGGTHASEWAGVMSTLYTVSKWIKRLEGGDDSLRDELSRQTVYIVPCISPDGFDHLMKGGAFVRSTLRPPAEGALRIGLEPSDITGDGNVVFMRWKHPAGPFVQDENNPVLMRPRTLSDRAEDAYFCCQEGHFLEYDGQSWQMAPAKHGLDLNRNFPVDWAPFAQFGMDGGAYPLSAAESRFVTEAVHARPNICSAVTNHTYTGCILVAPYSSESCLSSWDKNTLLSLAKQAVADTSYRVFRVYPDFQYEAKKPIPGVWASYLCSTVGIPAYTLELWDPYAQAGVDMNDPAGNFTQPDLDAIGKTVAHFAQDPANVVPWQTFDHPQLGTIEVGGLISTRTFRNPPTALLQEECERAYLVAERLRRAGPQLMISAQAHDEGGLHRVAITIENRGYLATHGLQRGKAVGLIPSPTLEIVCEGDCKVIGTPAKSPSEEIPGWGDAPYGFRANPLFPQLPFKGNILHQNIVIKGSGRVQITYRHARAGTVSSWVEI